METLLQADGPPISRPPDLHAMPPIIEPAEPARMRQSGGLRRIHTIHPTHQLASYSGTLTKSGRAASSNLCTFRPLLKMTEPVKNRRASESAPEGGYRLHPDTPVETTEQLRIAIDQGHAGDKVDVTDPAAAPLGTDDEAGGSPNTVAQVRLAAAHEVHARPNPARQQTSGLGAAWWLIGYTVFTGASIVASAVWIIP
jgi:hypothetical protein